MAAEEQKDVRRRRAVLESAMRTFAQAGYRTTSMDAVARAARISRPGLYFLFATKEALFREAATHVLTEDLAAIERILADTAHPLQDRLVAAFDRWTGRYIGPMGHDVPAVVAENPDLLDETARAAPAAFARLVASAIAVADPSRAEPLRDTLVSLSIGLKHQVLTRETYLDRFATGVALLIGAAKDDAGPRFSGE